MADLIVRGATVWESDGWDRRDVAVADGVIAHVAPLGAVELDGTGLRVVPGFVDLQCNGALGIDLTSEPERLWELAAALPRWGVTAWLPTIVTSPSEQVDRALAALADGPPDGWTGAWPLGLHLEGPFLSPQRRGAHAASLLRPPELVGWTRAGGVALVTLAPELPGAAQLIDALVEGGVVVALGHSDASCDEARSAVGAGAGYVTHLFNAMSPLHHREPGLVGAALSDERVHVGLIADGIHVAPTVVAVAHRALGSRLTLVTDAVAALGMPDGVHRLGRAEVNVDTDGVRLDDGTLAGSNLSMDQAVRNLIAFTGCEPHVGVAAATAGPARVLGDHSRGTLAAGTRGDLVLLDDDLRVVTTVVGGMITHRSR